MMDTLRKKHQGFEQLRGLLSHRMFSAPPTSPCRVIKPKAARIFCLSRRIWQWRLNQRTVRQSNAKQHGESISPIYAMVLTAGRGIRLCRAVLYALQSIVNAWTAAAGNGWRSDGARLLPARCIHIARTRVVKKGPYRTIWRHSTRATGLVAKDRRI